MSLSMRECIRWLKKEISDIVEEDPPLSDDEVLAGNACPGANTLLLTYRNHPGPEPSD